MSGFLDRLHREGNLPAIIAVCLLARPLLRADTNISPSQSHAYSGNGGWVNFAGEITNGVIVGEAFLPGTPLRNRDLHQSEGVDAPCTAWHFLPGSGEHHHQDPHPPGAPARIFFRARAVKPLQP